MFLAADALANAADKPYLVKEPGAVVLAGIARVDSIGIDSLSTPLGPTYPVSVIHCELIDLLGKEPAPREFSILSNAAAFSAKDFPNSSRLNPIFSPSSITNDARVLCISRKAKDNDVWYRIGDILLLVAVQNPEGRISSHDVRYVRFLHSPLENSHQKPMIQAGADTLKAAKEFWDRAGAMTHTEVYALIEGHYKEDSRTLKEILEEMRRFYQ
jgi:hypothetical protein